MASIPFNQRGTRPQRLLWASTGTKDPAARHTLWVEALAAPGFIITIPEQTLLAFADHGRIGNPLPPDAGYAEVVLAAFRREGIDDEHLAVELQREGAAAFADSWCTLLLRIAEKSGQLTREDLR